MVIITLKKIEFLKKIGRPGISDKEFSSICMLFGIELVEVTSEKMEYVRMNKDKLIKLLSLESNSSDEVVLKNFEIKRIKIEEQIKKCNIH